MKTCRCCKFQFEKGAECPRCGFNMIQTFDDEAEKEEQRLAEEHRNNLLDGIEGIQLVSYAYKVSAGKPDLTETKNVILASHGTDCYRRICWCSEPFAPTPSRKKERRSLEIYYFIDAADISDAGQSVTIDISLDNFDNMWHVGVMIDENFTIQVFLGNEENYTQSEKYPLKLK